MKFRPLSLIQKAQTLLHQKERRSLILLLLFMLIGVCLETLGVGLVVPALALFTQHDIAIRYPVLRPALEFLGNPDHQTLLVGGMLLLFFVYLVKAVFLGFLAWGQNRFTYELEARLSLRLFTIYLRQPYAFHLQRNSAQLIRNVTSEVGILISHVVTPLMQVFTESMVIAGLFLMLVTVEPLGTMTIVAIFGLAGFAFTRLTQRSMTRWGEARQYNDGQRFQHLQQGLGSAKDVKLLGRESEFLTRYKAHNNECARVGQLSGTMQQLPRLGLELLAIGGLAALVFTILAQGGEIETIIPKIGLFAVAAFRLIPSTNRILTAAQVLKYCLPVIEMLEKELTLPTEDPAESTKSMAKFSDKLILQDIAYTYPASHAPSLNRVSLTIPCGKSIGFIGSSGAGKSTLVDILLGLLKPDKGTILIDGIDIQENMRAWQNQIGYVPQSIYLTDDTLRRNVAFGIATGEIDEHAVTQAILSANLDEFVKSLPEGLDTIVGERGVRLSGGQRQRIGIARALYHNPAILVLDEATSALDTETEKGVMEAVSALQGSKTVIIVAHRLTTIKHCDQIYSLSKGTISSYGTPETLLATA